MQKEWKMAGNKVCSAGVRSTNKFDIHSKPASFRESEEYLEGAFVGSQPYMRIDLEDGPSRQLHSVLHARV